MDRCPPLVLLGIRTSLKEDWGCTTAELVYGTTLRLPGVFFSAQPVNTNPSGYVADLRSRPIVGPPHTATGVSGEVSNAVDNATHVFVRHNAVRKPLYSPHMMVHTRSSIILLHNNYYTLDINGRTDTVTLSRLKPAYLEDSPANTASPPPQAPTPILSQTQPLTENMSSKEVVSTPVAPCPTRTGQRVHWPTHLADYFAH